MTTSAAQKSTMSSYFQQVEERIGGKIKCKKMHINFSKRSCSPLTLWYEGTKGNCGLKFKSSAKNAY